MPTTSRLLLLLSLLQARRDWPGSRLAERLGISARTVRRDVDRLRELGYRIAAVKGPDGGYRLDAGSDLPPLLFDDDQAVAIAVALQTAAVSGVGLAESAERALTTVRQVMPSRLRHRVDALEVTAVPALGVAGAVVDPEVLMTLSAAVRDREILRFDYGTDPDAAVRRRVEPHHVVTWSGRWYLVAWDLDRADWRVFRADRIAPRVPTGPRFAPRALPAEDIETFVAARFKGSAGENRWPCEGVVIVSRPAAEIAPFVVDEHLEDLGAGRTRLAAGAWSWIALASSFGRFDAPLEVVGPVELADAFDELAERYARAARRG